MHFDHGLVQSAHVLMPNWQASDFFFKSKEKNLGGGGGGGQEFFVKFAGGLGR